MLIFNPESYTFEVPTLAKNARACLERSRRDGAPSVAMVSTKLTKARSPRLLVNFCLDMEELNTLKRTVDQAGNAVEKSQPQYVLVKEEK